MTSPTRWANHEAAAAAAEGQGEGQRSTQENKQPSSLTTFKIDLLPTVFVLRLV